MEQMTEQAKEQLWSQRFLVGRFQRRKAIQKLAESSGIAGVMILAEAIAKDHPDSVRILEKLGQLSIDRDGDKVRALWDAWVTETKPVLAEILKRLDWASVLANSSGLDGVLRLVEALVQGHPDDAQILSALGRLSIDSDGDKVEVLWQRWGENPQISLARVLTNLGWPSDRPVNIPVLRKVLSAAKTDAPSEFLKCVVELTRCSPVDDPILNDAIYAAWVRSQSKELEALITEQGRQPGSIGYEVLHILVTGRMEHYAPIRDKGEEIETTSFTDAFDKASHPLRERLARAVGASGDRRLMALHRMAVARGQNDVDPSLKVANLILAGDEDGLFDVSEHLQLVNVIELCEHWVKTSARPSNPEKRQIVERAVQAYRTLGEFRVEPGPELPEGLVDIFDYWRKQESNDADLRTDLDSEDPFRRARGLYLGQERGLVEKDRFTKAFHSKHWPERLVAYLANSSFLAKAKDDHVFWMSVCAGDASLLGSRIGGSPDEYQYNTKRIEQAHGPAAARTRGLLEILCNFQKFFVGGLVALDEIVEPPSGHESLPQSEDAPMDALG
ncbi:MAG: hypothetical protein HQL73_10445 [Magnetococcales bacterium]|nr:hypothetical protein [Magnetococcales bacterium]